MAARGRATVEGLISEARMNGLERDYRDYLALLLMGGRMQRFDFEPCKLRIAGDFLTTYTPDFRIVLNDGGIEYHEVKGRWMEDARVKIKVAAAQHPFVFRAITRRRKRDGWAWETFTPGAADWNDLI